MESVTGVGQFTGNVAIKGSLAPAEVFVSIFNSYISLTSYVQALSSLTTNLEVQANPGTRYLIFVCPMEQGLVSIGAKLAMK